jgi:glycosyltransferase involved in cell wall biosynthesis
MRVGFTVIGGENWTGGFHYLKNLLTALSRSESQSAVKPVVLSGPNVPAEMAAVLGAIHNVEFHTVSFLADRGRGGRLARALIYGRDPGLNEQFTKHRLDVVFEAADFFGWRLSVPAIAWMPDFQHRLLPEQFSRVAYWRRELGFRAQIAAGRIIMVSSRDSLNTCLRHYRVAPERLALVRFAVMPDAAPDAKAARAIADRYGLPKRFFYLPNQFWRHKNHLLVIDALGLLKQAGSPIVVAASGRPFDPRHPEHFAMLERRLVEKGLTEHFRLLGMIPHDDLIALMCACDAVLNASLSEGWSTTVEEARALGVPLLLSDLDVHKEQAGAYATYFDRYDAASLARVLGDFVPPGEAMRLEMANAAHVEAHRRVAQFATDFQAAVSQAALRPARNMPPAT